MIWLKRNLRTGDQHFMRSAAALKFGRRATEQLDPQKTLMANVTHFEPFGDLDDLFKGFFVRPMRFALDLPQAGVKVDVTKTDDTYTIKADMPGVKKDDITVAIEGNQITISGEVRKEKEEKKGEKVIRSERYYGKVSRSVTLPDEVDEGKARAQYADGVLNLTLPTRAKSTGKRIAVN